MRKVFLLLFVTPFLLLPGCTQKIDLGLGYAKLSKRFEQAMRWQDFESAAMFLQDPAGQKALARWAENKDLHIVEADFRYSRLNKKAGTAESELLIKYYLLPSTQVKEWSWKIDWILIAADTKQAGNWQVLGLPPTFPAE